MDALNKRIAAIGAENRACAVVSDYRDTESLRRALTRQRFKGLTFCLIDPTSCDIPFDSIRAIKKYSGYKCDMLITFFDLVDFIRNAVNSVNNPAFAQTQSRYAEFLGANDFFKRQDVVEAADYNNTKFLLEAFRDTYRTQLKSLDYLCSELITVSNFYQLLFVSEHIRGVDFWKKAVSVEPSGQTTFNF